MAKRAKKVGEGRTKAPAPPIQTLDERDVTTAKERREERAIQQEYATEKESQNRKDFEESDPLEADERADVSHLPITHPTIPDERDKGQLPPEATPREGKSSPAPPFSVPAVPESQRDDRARGKNRVLVEATQMGYYDHTRRRAGETFYINDPADFSKRWMRKAPSGAKPMPATLPNAAIRREHDAILAGKISGVTGGIDQAPEANPLDAD